MTKVKRFVPCNHRSSDNGMKEAADGGWVKWDDYKLLQSKYDEIESQPDALTAYLYAAELSKGNIIALRNEVKFLKSKNERLKSAGDALYRIACNSEPKDGRVEKLDAWKATKEWEPNE